MSASKPLSHRSYYSTLQLFVAFTFVFVVFLTAKFTSVTLFDTRPERVRGAGNINHVHKQELRFDIIATPQKKAPKKFDYIIENQRLRIGSDMDQFPFDQGDQLKDFIMDQGGQPVRAMVSIFIDFLLHAYDFIGNFRSPRLGEVDPLSSAIFYYRIPPPITITSHWFTFTSTKFVTEHL